MRSILGQRDPITRAVRSIALQVGAATAVVVLVAIFSAGFIFDRQQLGEISGRVETAALSADDVIDAPPGVWLIEVTGTAREVTVGTPPAVADAAVAAAARSGPGSSGPVSLTADGQRWPAWIARRQGRVFVAAYDFRLHGAEERRLITSTVVAGAAGVGLAGLTGLLAGRRAVRPLAQALDLQDQFVADASHELRTPLAVISIRAQLLRRHLSAETGSATRVEVDRLVADTEAMADVVSDLLLSAQLEQGEVGRAPVDVHELATAVVISLEPYAAESGVRLVAPSAVAGEPPVVSGVSSSLRRAILALVDNAIDHSPGDSRVEVVVGRTGSEVRVDVADHGAGVATSEVEGLTRRFARARNDGSTRRVGLGLALVTQIVQSHGGRLEVVETHGGGATFSLVFPAAPGS